MVTPQKAAQNRRTPKPDGRSGAFVLAIAFWSAAVTRRFLWNVQETEIRPRRECQAFLTRRDPTMPRQRPVHPQNRLSRNALGVVDPTTASRYYASNANLNQMFVANTA